MEAGASVIHIRKGGSWFPKKESVQLGEIRHHHNKLCRYPPVMMMDPPTPVAFHQNQARGVWPLGKRYHRWRAERVERTFAHVCETGGARRTQLRERANVAMRYLLH